MASRQRFWQWVSWVNVSGAHQGAFHSAAQSPFLEAEKEISPPRIWVCLLPLFVCLSDRPSFRRDILTHPRFREVKPLRRALHSSRSEYAYLKVVRKIESLLHPGEPAMWYHGKNLGFGSKPIWCHLLTLQTLSNDLKFSELSFLHLSKWPSSLPHRLVWGANAIVCVKQ